MSHPCHIPVASPLHPRCIPVVSPLCPHHPHCVTVIHIVPPSSTFIMSLSFPSCSHHPGCITVISSCHSPCEPVAHRCDGKCWGSHAISPINCPPSLVDPSSTPVIHPVSRCSQRWWWWYSLSPIVSPPSHLPSPLLFHPPTIPQAVAREARVGGVSSVVLCRSTHYPPHEQLLMRLEGQGASSVVGVVVVHHLSAMVSGVRWVSVTWCMSRGQKVPTMWVSHSLGLPASLVALLYLNDTPHIPF
jgi:hypothetical protein